MLKHISSAFQKCRFAVEKKLFVNDPQKFDPANDSNIRATVFGPSGTYVFKVRIPWQTHLCYSWWNWKSFNYACLVGA